MEKMQIVQIVEGNVSNGPVIKVVGIGGGGGNAVNRMVTCDLHSVEFVAANTDLQDLRASKAQYKLQLGAKCTNGLGAGAKPEVGREAALENIDAIRDALSGADMVFITAGMGGGTGTGAAPIIAQAARDLGCLTVGVVTKPFKFEGFVRRKNAEEGMLIMRKHVDTLIVIPNDNLLVLVDKNTSLVDAFAMADDVLRVAVQGISDLITKEALINLDFADVRTVMRGMGQAIMGMGVGTGDNRAIEAAEKAIRSPLLDDCRVNGAKGLLINVTGPPSLGLLEAHEAVTYITEQADKEAMVIFGAAVNPEMPEEQIEVTVIATGFHEGGLTPRVPSNPPSASIPFEQIDAKRTRTNAEHALLGGGAKDGSRAFNPATNTTIEIAVKTPEIYDLKHPKIPAHNPATDDLILGDAAVGTLLDDDLCSVEDTPHIPPVYQSGRQTAQDMKKDLDIPAFIRRRARRMQSQDDDDE